MFPSVLEIQFLSMFLFFESISSNPSLNSARELVLKVVYFFLSPGVCSHS